MSQQPTGQAPTLDYQTLDDLGGQVAAAVLAVWLLRPTMPEQEWLDLVVSVLLAGILQAEQWGRLYGSVAAPVNGIPGLPTDGVPRRPAPVDFTQRSAIAPRPEPVIDFAAREAEITDRLHKAVETLATEDASVARVERFAHDEPIAAAQRGYQDGIRLQEEAPGSNGLAPVTPLMGGYRRGINPDCCELCFWLWKEGYVYPIDQPMHRHTGCRCVPVATSDRVGKSKLNASDSSLLADLYDRFIYKKDTQHAAA